MCDTPSGHAPRDGPDALVQAGQPQAGHLQAVLANMAQGLCLFDREQRLIVGNDRYATLYGLDPAQVRPGMSLREIVALRAAVGAVPRQSAEDYLRAREAILASNEASETLLSLRNGSVIAIRHQPMPDGGWLSTHEDITARRAAERRLAYVERVDPATGLPNQSALMQPLQDRMNQSSAEAPSAVLILGLEGLQGIADTLGVAAADSVLRTVAERIRNRLRASDLLARMGPDRFLVAQCDGRQPADAAVLAEDLLRDVCAPITLAGQRMALGASIGAVLAADPCALAAEVLKSAGVALHRASTEPNGRFRWFESEMDAALQARRAFESDLRDAVAHLAFEVHYQPQFNVRTGRVTCFEALARWTHPVDGPVPPATFIAAAERLGLIHRIGEWVLERACTDALQWPGEVSVAVNVSALQLGDGTLPGIVQGVLARTGLAPSRLELEITETSVMGDLPLAAAALRQMRAFGVRIAMDDFGTGYSSLGALPQLPIDKIKVDRSFAARLGQGAAHSAILQSIVGLCASLDVSCTVEGVETAEQLELVTPGGCTEVQGFLLGRPCPVDALPGFFGSQAAMGRVRPLRAAGPAACPA